MKKWLSKYLKSYMVRPIITKTLGSLIVAGVLALLWERFVNVHGWFETRTYVLPVLSAFFAAKAWFTFLRLDHLALPELPKRRKTKKVLVRSMIDSVDTDTSNDEELQDDEKSICALVSSLICCLILMLISLF